MIKKINHSRLRNAEFLEFNRQVLSFLSDANPHELGISNQYNQLQKELEAISELFRLRRGSKVTKELKQISEKRTELLVGLRTVLLGYTYHYEQEKAEAANYLLNKFDKLGMTIYHKSNAEQSAIVNKLVHQWRNDKTKTAHVRTLGVEGWISTLQSTNKTFEEAVLKRVRDLSKKPSLSFKHMRPQVHQSYQELMRHLEALCIIHKENTSRQRVLSIINEHIEYYQQLIHQRRKG